MDFNNFLLWYARNGFPKSFRESAFRKFCRRNRGRRLIADCLPGFRMHTCLGDSVDNQLYVRQFLEAGTTSVIDALSVCSEAFVDVGCNIGYYSCLFGTRRRGFPLVAIDPNPAMIQAAGENLELNQIPGYKLLNCGIGDSAGTLELHVPQSRHSLASFAYVPSRGGPVESIQCAVQTLSAVLDDHQFNNVLIKIDTEGFEHAVFSGLSARSVEQIRFIVFELASDNLRGAGRTPKEVLSLPVLKQFDFYLVHDAQGGCIESTTPERICADPDVNANVLLVRNDPETLAILKQSQIRFWRC